MPNGTPALRRGRGPGEGRDSTLRYRTVYVPETAIWPQRFFERERWMNEYIEMLGRSLDDVLAGPACQRLPGPHTLELLGDRIHAAFRESGVGFVANLDRRIISIQFHAEGHEQFGQFAGGLPDDIAFTDSAAVVRKQLGPPSASGGNKIIPILGRIALWERYDRGSYSVHFQYSLDAESITLISLIHPEAVPR
jgi:hypothetical protein